MSSRLITVEGKRKNEILNHYRTLIDQSIANGNSEESAVESFGNVNTLCRLILKKEEKFTVVPIIYTVLHWIGFAIKILLLIAAIGALVFGMGAAATGGYSLATLTLEHFMPSSVLLSTNLIAAAFKAGACLITASVLLILLMLIKVLLTFVIKIAIYMINCIKDAVYMAQSTKMMKEAFDIEAVN